MTREEMLREIRESGVGTTVSEELLNLYHVRRSEERNIPTRDGETHIFLHYPDVEETPLPVLVNIHGGGFVKGHRQQDIVFSKNMCSRAKCLVVDIDYIPAPEQKYPYAIHQCYDTVKWVYENADSLGADPDRIALCGHSAGGNCVAAVSLMANASGEFPIRLQILDYPCLDVYTPSELKRNAYKNSSLLPGRSNFYNDCYIDPIHRLEPTASPLFAPDEMLLGLPEAVVLSCKEDCLGEEAEKYAYRLLQAGVPVTARRFYESNHGFVVRRQGQYQEAEEIILSALGRAFSK